MPDTPTGTDGRGGFTPNNKAMIQWISTEERLPPALDGWQHSARVLVFYAKCEHYEDAYGIAYYHYAPPFEREAEWIDWQHGGYEPPAFWAAIEPPQGHEGDKPRHPVKGAVRP